jgi:hexosaminidase
MRDRDRLYLPGQVNPVTIMHNVAAAWHDRGVTTPAAASTFARASRIHDLVPKPAIIRPAPDRDFRLTASTRILARGETAAVGEYLAEVLRPATGFPLPVVDSGSSEDAIVLRLGPGFRPGEYGEGYSLSVVPSGVRLESGTPAGLAAGVQTLRQLLPPAIYGRQTGPGPWDISGGDVIDWQRFAHRGAMLDVARHFFTVDDVKRFIDLIAQYKLNVLHLHLTDDQGWRIEIKGWPDLARIGGASQIGGGPGGYYTQAQYADLVAYAATRHVAVIPEIDVPGHVNAALGAYPELNADGIAKEPFLVSGSAVGFSSLCTDTDVTYRFLEDVLAEVAALTPGPYLHIGADEAHATSEDGYVVFVNRVLAMVARHGKTAIGWHELLRAAPASPVVAQYWGRTDEDPVVSDAVARGHRVVLSPPTRAYLDMKYTTETTIGFKWAAYIDVADAYGWDPGTFLRGVPAEAVLGLEAPLWTETVERFDQVEYMAFPRLAAIAELGWSPPSTHDWPDFARRLATHGPRWAAAGVNFYRSAQVDWL